MATTFNSASALIETTAELQQQVLQSLAMITESLTTAQETVTISYLSNGTTTTYEIPSFGFIKSEIKRIDANIKLLSGFTTGSTNLRQPDGTYQRIYVADIIDSPDALTNLPVPSTFQAQNNWFFESFLNPLLYVAIDVTGQIDQDTERVMKKRVILNDNSASTVTFFNNYLKGKNDVDYNTLFDLLQTNGISWFIDDDTIDLPVNTLQYTGTFDVMGITDQVIPVIQNGTTIQTKVRTYTLAALTYTDNTDILANTQTLKVGDQVVSGTTSIYQVATINTSLNQVSFMKVSGYEPITIGAASLRIYSQASPNRYINVNIGHDERQIIFFKPINRQTNIAALNWSQGVAFNSSDLTMNGNVTLDQYYQEVVSDFGSYFLSLAKEKVVPSVLGLVPAVPVLDASNFQVVQINTHITDTQTQQTILSLASQKVSLESSLNQLDTSIAQTKAQLGNTNFVDVTERNTVQNTLDSLITQKTSQSNLYSSLVTQLVSLGQSNPNTLDPPIYHIRGFWAIPGPQFTTQTGNQEIIQFVIQYRYIRPDGNTGGISEIDFTDSSGTVTRAFFSNWIEARTDIRTKTYNTSTGRYEWDDEDVSDPDAVNINSLDIPITQGEQVEIRIKSVSEAGWPLNPLTSDWCSPTVIIPFPASLSTQDAATAAIADAASEQTLVQFQNQLTSIGLDQHLEDSIIIADKYYAHGADRISSGYFDTNGNVISLLAKLQSLDLQLASLQALITQAKGTLSVSIIDSSGNITQISNNTTIDIFSGYYQDIIGSMAASDQKGAIITKVFYLGLSNTAASTLELMSIYSGAFGAAIPNSATSGDNYAKFAYDKANMVLNTTSTFNLGTINQPSPFQSGQVLSQYLYVRGKDLSLTTNVFDTPATGTPWIEPINIGPDSSLSNPFVWSGTGTTGNGVISEFCVHTSHPQLQAGITLEQLQDPYTPTNQQYPAFRHSAFFNLQQSDPNGIKQLQYIPADGIDDRGKYPQKLGFYVNDRYLIGSNTCGSYLFLAPNKYSDLQVNGNDSNAVQTLQFGTANTIKIPVIFQFRMTDYYGANPTDTGLIGGWNSTNSYPQNLVYSKQLGFDISVLNDTTFSFDLSVTAKYKKDTLSQFTVSGGSSTTLVI